MTFAFHHGLHACVQLAVAWPKDILETVLPIEETNLACVAGGIVGFSAHKQAAKPRQTSGAAASGLGRRSCSSAPSHSRLRRSFVAASPLACAR